MVFSCRWILSAGLSWCCFAADLLTPPEFPVYARSPLYLCAFFSAAWAVLGFRVFKRGSLNLKSETTVYYGMAWVLPVIMLTLFMMFSPNDLVGLRMITCGIVFLIMGAAFLLRGVAERSELQTREKLLEIEYHLAEIEELVKGASPVTEWLVDKLPVA